VLEAVVQELAAWDCPDEDKNEYAFIGVDFLSPEFSL